MWWLWVVVSLAVVICVLVIRRQRRTSYVQHVRYGLYIIIRVWGGFEIYYTDHLFVGFKQIGSGHRFWSRAAALKFIKDRIPTEGAWYFVMDTLGEYRLKLEGNVVSAVPRRGYPDTILAKDVTADHVTRPSASCFFTYWRRHGGPSC